MPCHLLKTSPSTSNNDSSDDMAQNRLSIIFWFVLIWCFSCCCPAFRIFRRIPICYNDNQLRQFRSILPSFIAIRVPLFIAFRWPCHRMGPQCNFLRIPSLLVKREYEQRDGVYYIQIKCGVVLNITERT